MRFDHLDLKGQCCVVGNPEVDVCLITLSPNADGSFEITLPDLASQPGMNDAHFQLILSGQGTSNIFLRLVEDSSETHDLKVLHEYPAVVRFTAEEFSPIKH